MNLRGLVGRSIATGASVARFLTGSRRGLRILAYHAVGTPAIGDSLGIFSIDPEMFRRHMDLLVDSSAGAVVPLSPETEIGEELKIAITFDDGYRDNLRVAAPVLVERGLPFTVFVISNPVRDGQSGFLSPAELRELAELPGVTIGAHGASHTPLARCAPGDLKQELISSKSWLEDTIGREVTTMSYPHGSVNPRVRDAVAEAGYKLAACSYSDINNRERDRLLLGRTSILRDDTRRIFRQKLAGDWDWYRFLGHDPAGRA